MAYNKFRRAYEVISDNLRKVDGFDGKIIAGFFRAANTNDELVKIYGDFHLENGCAIEMMTDSMLTGAESEYGNVLDRIRLNLRFMYSYRAKPDGGYDASSQEIFDEICTAITNTFKDTISGSTGESKYYVIHPLDRDAVTFPGADVFGLTEFVEFDKLVHLMQFALDVTLETT